VISYLKVLDISNTGIKFCSDAILQSLQSCVIEKLAISDTCINDSLTDSIFLNAYYDENRILNFRSGIPLTIVNNLQKSYISLTL